MSYLASSSDQSENEPESGARDDSHQGAGTAPASPPAPRRRSHGDPSCHRCQVQPVVAYLGGAAVCSACFLYWSVQTLFGWKESQLVSGQNSGHAMMLLLDALKLLRERDVRRG